jgi:hypothetical protein
LKKTRCYSRSHGSRSEVYAGSFPAKVPARDVRSWDTAVRGSWRRDSEEQRIRRPSEALHR